MLSLLARILLVWIPIAAADPFYETCDTCTDRATTEQLANMSIILFTGNNLEENRTATIDSAADLVRFMDPAKSTVAYIFGWTEYSTCESVQTVSQAYLDRGDYNVLLVDWGDIAKESYIFVYMSIESVGKAVAHALNSMVIAGLDETSIHVVSHSMGSQVAGYMGRNTNFAVEKIVGLDPAGPGFDSGISHLNGECGNFIMLIHTDIGQYGSDWADSNVNFYPNLGTRIQPGCSTNGDDFCSHQRSWHYYAESLLDESAYVGVKCKSAANWLMNRCGDAETAIMGYKTPTDAYGSYFLQTNSAAPYGLGRNGIQFNATLFDEYSDLE